MVGPKLLLTAALAVVLWSVGFVSAAGLSPYCAGVAIGAGGCAPPSVSAEADGRGVTLEGVQTSPGGASGDAPGQDVDDAGVVTGEQAPVRQNAENCPPVEEREPGRICRDNVTITFAGTDIPWQPITVRDIEGFVPETPRLVTEPAGWAVRRLPANFVSSGGRHQVAGLLLGRPADVRFTPIAWRWDFGDGTTGRTTTPGAAWGASGLRPFSATATSHVYTARGEVTVSVSVEYTAEYRFAGGEWAGVDGVVVAEGPRAPLLVASASTVLVDGVCHGRRTTTC